MIFWLWERLLGFFRPLAGLNTRLRPLAGFAAARARSLPWRTPSVLTATLHLLRIKEGISAPIRSRTARLFSNLWARNGWAGGGSQFDGRRGRHGLAETLDK